MGVSIDVYRQRIGCHTGRKFKMKTKYYSTKSNRVCNNYKLLSLLFKVVLLQIIYQEATTTFSQWGAGELHSFHVTKTSWSEQEFVRNSYPVDVNFNARYKFGNKKRGGIKIMHWNAGGGFLKNKIHEIENVISGYKPHLLGISETSFKSSHDISDIQIQDYKIFFSQTLENPRLNVSRCAVYVHKDVVKPKLRLDLMSSEFSSVWLEINLPKQKRILVGNAYRDWQYLGQNDNSSLNIEAQLERFTKFVDKWETALASNMECHLLGDLNLNFLEYSKPSIPTNSQSYKLRSLIQLLSERILPLGAVQCVGVATRVWANQEPSGLDHYYTTNPRKLSDVQAINIGSSDHKIIFATRFAKNITRNPRIIKKRSYKNFNAQEFLSAVRNISWWKIYSCEDVNLAVKMLSEELTLILDKMAPIKVVQVRTNYAPWLSKNTKDLMKQRDLAQQKASSTNQVDDWKAFRRIRNRVTNILRTEKKLYQTKRLVEADGDISRTWKTVKSWLGWSSGGPPTQLMENGLLISKPSALAECMNSFFTRKVNNLRANLPPNQQSPLNLVRKLMENRTCSFVLQPVHPDTVEKIISSLKSTKSCGLDNIDSYIIKLAKDELVPAITHILNLSINQMTFPAAWKTAKVIPLYKKDEYTDPKNYRPVALLAVFSKILEKAVFLQVMDYMEKNNLLHPSHHGFRSKHNTGTALLEMYDGWVDAFDEDKLTAVIMLDLSAAFDVVDTSILLDKLGLYGFQPSAVSWIKSYLTNRHQQVYVDGALSDPQEVTVGVPQGSILGPLLYIIFTNDLPEVIHNHSPPQTHSQNFFNMNCKDCGGVCCYADDSTLSVSNTNPELLQIDINTKYKQISDYMAMNKLFLNSDKTHLLIMTSQCLHKKNDNYGIHLDTGFEAIQPSYNERLLGAQISNNFTWNSHISEDDKSMCKALTPRINALVKISWSADFKTRKMIANAIVMSRLIYLIQLYSEAADYLLTALQVLQNKAARAVTRLPWGTRTAVLLNQVGWLSIKQLAVYHKLISIFKIKENRKPVYLSEKISTDFNYQTRQATGSSLKVNKTPKSGTAKESFVHSSTVLWNTLPMNLRNTQKLTNFKTGLRSWVKETIPI